MPDSTRRLIATHVSQAYWCERSHNSAVFRPAQVAIGTGPTEEIAWLDELLKGGIWLPPSQGRPLTILVTGPPGSGKTTLALELCYRMAKHNGLFSLFLSTEAEEQALVDNNKAYGFADVENTIVPFEDYRPGHASVAVRGVKEFQDSSRLVKLVEAAVHDLARMLKAVPANLVEQIVKRFPWQGARIQSEGLSPAVLVFDSLNVVPATSARSFFEQVLGQVSGKADIMIFVLDSGARGQEHETWEYVCDIVIRVDYGSPSDYYIRTLEIVKARYQEHVWGRHQLKIYPAFSDDKRKSEVERLESRRQAHPWREEGGIFVYPSIHYYLSQYKRQAPARSADFADTKPDELNDVLGRLGDQSDAGSVQGPGASRTSGGGLPQGRCTAFIGSRGGHKSHLAYLHLLHRILNRDEGGLIVSLRDDEHMTIHTLTRIAEQEELRPPVDFAELERQNRFEVLYYHPGYITPEEFFHRLFISVQRLKTRPKQQLTVLFNSLDQLSARFPLCAEQRIFIPGIINLLCGERITSIFIGVEEPGQPLEQYGLLPMADLILSFNRRRFSFDHYYGHIEDGRGFAAEARSRAEGIKEKLEGGVREEVVLEVVRFAGGQRSGARGLLELVERRGFDESLYDRPGLHFTPLSTKYDAGEPI